MDLSKMRSSTPRTGAAFPLPSRNRNRPSMNRSTAPVTNQAAQPTTPTQAAAPRYTIRSSAPVPVTGAGSPFITPSVKPNAPAPAPADPYAPLRVVIERAVREAHSEHLPSDQPGLTRSLQSRRRHHVVLAAISYAAYNPGLCNLDDALLKATQMAYDAMHHYNEAHKAQHAAAQAPAAPVVERSKMWGAVEKLHAKLTGAATPRYYKASDVEREPRLKNAGWEYLMAYKASGVDRTDAFMASVRSKVDVRPEYGPGSLSDKQVRAILNIWMDAWCDANKVARPQRPARWDA